MSKEVHSQGKVPFSWEKKPGVSKATARPPEHNRVPPRKLPPPPCPPGMLDARLSSVRDSQIPRVRLSRSASRKDTKKVTDDPFLIAYKEVTKSDYKKDKGLIRRSEKGDRGLGALRNIFMFSCKVQSSCIVQENSVVRFSELPISRSYRDGGHN
ncbi:Unknown protein [Striga hermonthica]|uniref:Uncharacterized protein n=1 Tax=Striga hermonthica TaxID=68872 RepID=A0A9N7N5U6_STRHE|nr:Unknown protein [Striga hermonthica]